MHLPDAEPGQAMPFRHRGTRLCELNTCRILMEEEQTNVARKRNPGVMFAPKYKKLPFKEIWL
jgi:hypothetical protein